MSRLAFLNGVHKDGQTAGGRPIDKEVFPTGTFGPATMLRLIKGFEESQKGVGPNLIRKAIKAER